MGGDFYDRPVYSNPTPTYSRSNYAAPTYSTTSNSAMKNSKCLHKSCDPKRWQCENITTDHKTAIVFALDVTGSMGVYSKVVYDKLPMLYGQMNMQSYVIDSAISFCGIGDAKYDSAPLQICDFAQGKEIDQMITKIWLEGRGGGNHVESYGLSAFFYLSRCDICSSGETPFFFFTGDEGFYEEIDKEHISRVLGINCKTNMKTDLVFQELKKKFRGNVFMLKKPYKPNEKKILKRWQDVLGVDHVIVFEKPKAVVDIILGIIAVVSGKRTLQEI